MFKKNNKYTIYQITDTSILSDLSLKAVLDWAWSKFKRIKSEMNQLCKRRLRICNPFSFYNEI